MQGAGMLAPAALLPSTAVTSHHHDAIIGLLLLNSIPVITDTGIRVIRG